MAGQQFFEIFFRHFPVCFFNYVYQRNCNLPDTVKPMSIATNRTTSQQGLSSAKAVVRLNKEGANELPASGTRHLGRIALDVLREPMLLLLLSAVGRY
jgi:magnesium-transporting ATPase (P-type)